MILSGYGILRLLVITCGLNNPLCVKMEVKVLENGFDTSFKHLPPSMMTEPILSLSLEYKVPMILYTLLALSSSKKSCSSIVKTDLFLL